MIIYFNLKKRRISRLSYIYYDKYVPQTTLKTTNNSLICKVYRDNNRADKYSVILLNWCLMILISLKTILQNGERKVAASCSHACNAPNTIQWVERTSRPQLRSSMTHSAHCASEVLKMRNKLLDRTPCDRSRCFLPSHFMNMVQ